MQGVISATVEEFPLLSLQFFSRFPCIHGSCPEQSAGLVCIPGLTEGMRKQGEKLNPGLGELALSLNHTTPQSSRLDALAQLLSSTGTAVIFLLMQLCVTLLCLHQQEWPTSSLLS